MRKPTIHINGTSGNVLSEQYATAARAVNEAINALGEAAPNGRDYYPQGPGAITEATAEHKARLTKLRTVHAELLELWDYTITD